MVPVVSTAKELRIIVPRIKAVQEELGNAGVELHIPIGTVLELPRTCETADQIVATDSIELINFGTNDLTQTVQTVWGFFRDDAIRFICRHQGQGLLGFDPFARIDEEGVGGLIKMAIEKARATQPETKVGICGEHGGEPNSVQFFDHVSFSPFRVPIARISAGQAAAADAVSAQNKLYREYITNVKRMSKQ